MEHSTTPESRSVIVERSLSHPPAKVWRALTEGHLIEDWLMKNDFKAAVGHRFTFRTEPMPHWNGIVEAEVLIVEPHEKLAYTWATSGANAGLQTVVTFTLTPEGTGTRLKMEQSGFGPNDENNLRGSTYGWQKFLGQLEGVLEGLG